MFYRDLGTRRPVPVAGAIASRRGDGPAFLAGTAVAGAGFGLGFSGAFRMTMAQATPSQSAGLVTAGPPCLLATDPPDGNPATTTKTSG